MAEDAGRTTRRGPRRRLASALLAASLLPLNSTMIAVALPDVARVLDRPPGTVTQALVTGYLVAAIVLQSPGGKLGDRIGHWRMFALGQLLIAAGAVLGAFAPVLVLLALARILIAAGGAVLVPATVALMRIELPADRRGRAFGAFGSMMSLAAALGPLLGGELVHRFGWPSVFLVNLPVLAVSALLVIGARGDGPAGSRTIEGGPGQPRFDWVGSVLLGALLTAFVLGLQTAGAMSLALLGTCLLLIVPFVWWERRIPEPVVSFALFRSLPFAAGSLLIAVQNLTLYTLVIEMAQVLPALLALDAATTGRLLVSMMIAVVVTSPVAGLLTDRFGCRPLAVAGSVITLFGLALLAVAGPAAVPLPLAVLGIGLGLATPAAQNAALSAVPRRLSGTAAGMSSTMRYLGGVVGVATLGRLIDLDADPATLAHEHLTLLGIFAAALLIGLVCAVLLPGRRPAAVGSPTTAVE